MAQDISWASLADVGYGLVGGLTKGLSALGKFEQGQANADAANLIREGKNEVKRSAASLAGVVKSINMQRQLKAAGERMDAITTTALRTQDAFVRRNFEDSVRGAEALGRAAGGRAASGLGGSSLEAISQTVKLRNERGAEALQSGQAQQLADFGVQAAGQVPGAIEALDVSPITFDADYNVTQNKVAMPNILGMTLAGLEGKTDSIKTFLGSLKDYESPAQAAALEGAVSTPVSQSQVRGTPLQSFEIGPYPDDTLTFLKRAPTPYANSIDALNTRIN